MLSHCFLDFSMGERGFVKGLSQMSSLFSDKYIRPKRSIPHRFKRTTVLLLLLATKRAMHQSSILMHLLNK